MDKYEILQGLYIDGSKPISFTVVEYTPEDHATPLFGIVANYVWCERILFSNAYEKDAAAICSILTFMLSDKE